MTRVNAALVIATMIAAVSPSAAADSAASERAPLYRCVRGAGSQPIQLAPNIDALCRRHPEMGPCKYERETCRQSGGRVVDASGREITPAIEAEYDKRVHRLTIGGEKAR